jgi:hypothetical protein
MLQAQPVDAASSKQCFNNASPGEPIFLPLLDQNLARVLFRLNLPFQPILAFVITSSWVRVECCVDPLRPPDISGNLMIPGR